MCRCLATVAFQQIGEIVDDEVVAGLQYAPQTTMSDNAYPAPATRQSWPNVRPLPAEHAPLVVEREFTQQEYARIACGVVPEQMEDK